MFPASISMGLIDAILGYGLGLHVRGLMWEYLHRLFLFQHSVVLKLSKRVLLLDSTCLWEHVSGDSHIYFGTVQQLNNAVVVILAVLKAISVALLHYSCLGLALSERKHWLSYENNPE